MSVQEFLISAWTLPESVRYAVIRQRHDARADSPYVPEAARFLVAAATACAEIIGTGKNPPGADGLRTMADWYRSHFDPNTKMAIVAQDRPRRAGVLHRRLGKHCPLGPTGLVQSYGATIRNWLV